MGPLALLGLTGLDTWLSELEALQAEFGGSRYAPCPPSTPPPEPGSAANRAPSGSSGLPAQVTDCRAALPRKIGGLALPLCLAVRPRMPGNGEVPGAS